MSRAPGEWWFYQLTAASAAAAAIGPLVEKCLERGWRVLILGEETTLSRLDEALWTWRADSFIPHGRWGEDRAEHPVLLTSEPVNANGARVVMLLDGRGPPEQGFERIMTVFDAADPDVVRRAREQYRNAQAEGRPVRFFQLEASGWAERGGSAG